MILNYIDPIHLVIATAIGLAICTNDVFVTTIFLHRAKTHMALTLHPKLESILKWDVWATMGLTIREYVAVHRKHHAFTDETGDPHSRYAKHGGGSPRRISPGVLDAILRIEHISGAERFPVITPEDVRISRQDIERFTIRMAVHRHDDARGQSAQDHAVIPIAVGHLGQILVGRP